MSTDPERAALERRLFQLTERLVHERPGDPIPAFLQRRIEKCVDALHGKLDEELAASTHPVKVEEDVAVNSESDSAPKRAPENQAASSDLPELKRTAPLLPRTKRKTGGKGRRNVWK